MTRSLRVVLALGIVVGLGALIALSGCLHHSHGGQGHRGPAPREVVVHKAGPPPHAPAHGYRQRHHHHSDLDLVFDSGMGVYVVVGMEDLFFHRDHFYRVMGGVWQRSLRIDRGWVVAHQAWVPRGLAKKHRKARKHHKKHHGHPAKYGH